MTILDYVLPASAGMILTHRDPSHIQQGAPRIRGDDPAPDNWLELTTPCSPHPRG